MAPRNEAKVLPPGDALRCQTCGWWDRKLRVVGSVVTSEERLAIHEWAHHGQPLPAWMAPVKAPDPPPE